MPGAPTISSVSTISAPPLGGASGSPAAPTGSVDDLLGSLSEFSWKNVPFPVEETELEVRQDLVIHRFTDRNGAYVEGTGRHPVQITARIPFLNQIYPAGQETWLPGTLYPYQWRLFLIASLQGTSGTLMHPELGPLNCKIDLAHTTWKGSVRGGVWVRATWIESDDSQADQLGVDLSVQSPAENLTISAGELDAAIATLLDAVAAQQQPPALTELQFSFSDLAFAVTGVIDTTTLLQKQYQGRLANLVFQANEVEGALDRSPLMGPLSWPIFQSAERVKDAAYNAQAQPTVASGPPVLVAAIQKDSTLAQAALSVGADITDFITLNFPLVAAPVIPKGTRVRYYSNAA
jgi:hypothetical protein